MNIETILIGLNQIALEEQRNKQTFKVIAYRKAMKAIRESGFTGEVKAASDLDDIKSVGKGVKEKIQMFIDKQSDPEIQKKYFAVNLGKAVWNLTRVHGIGETKAQALAAMGITTIDELQKRVDADPSLLNNKQMLGLKYVKEYMNRIERKEMVRHSMHVQRAARSIPEIKDICLVGSYRRGLENSGDIDVIITGDDGALKSFVDKLKEKGYLHKEEFAYGAKKFLGLSKLPDSDTHRRIDILLTSAEEYPYALLYFTGSKLFNIKLRAAALQRGLSLNEHMMIDVKTREPVRGLTSEKEILEYLGFKYVDPKKRC